MDEIVRVLAEGRQERGHRVWYRRVGERYDVQVFLSNVKGKTAQAKTLRSPWSNIDMHRLVKLALAFCTSKSNAAASTSKLIRW